MLGLRGFAGFLPSLYCETLKSTPFRPFLRCPWERLSWQPLVAGLLRAFPDTTLTLYIAEGLRGAEPQLLSELLGLPADEIRRATGSERPGFSTRAIAEMEAAHIQGGLGPRQAKALAAAHPRGPGALGFDPWTPAERVELQERYAVDLETLRGWDRVHLFDPAALVSAKAGS